MEIYIGNKTLDGLDCPDSEFDFVRFTIFLGVRFRSMTELNRTQLLDSSLIPNVRCDTPGTAKISSFRLKKSFLWNINIWKLWTLAKHIFNWFFCIFALDGTSQKPHPFPQDIPSYIAYIWEYSPGILPKKNPFYVKGLLLSSHFG